MASPCMDFSMLRFQGLQSSYTTFFIGLVQLFALFLLIGWQVVHQYRARCGKASASELMVSPSYLWILMAYGFTSALMGTLNVFSEIKKYPEVDKNELGPSITMGVAWGLYHMVLDGLTFFLCMNGSGWIALKRAFRCSIGVFVVIGGLQTLTNLWHWWAPDGGMAWGLGTKLASEALLFFPYLALVILPHSVLHRRPAAVFYAAFWTVYRPIYTVIVVLLYLEIDSAFCIYLPFTLIVYGFFIPALVVITLRKDAMYWQGVIARSIVDNGTMERSPSQADIRTPLLGTLVEYDTAQTLADKMDTLDSTCPTISFAHLKLTKTTTANAILGAGGTARVFRGTYKDEKVAIKMLYCMTLTPETVHNFFQESTLLCKLQHPNIVHVSGVCVLPPTICMVMELCNGSLYEFLRLDSTFNNLDWEDRLTIAIECVSAVTCLHEQNPPILHMDLKSPNFLLGEQLIPKWSTKDVQTWLTTMRLPTFKRTFRYNNIDGKTLLRHDAKSLAPFVGKDLANSEDFPRLIDAVADLNNAMKRKSKHGVIKLTDLELSQEEEETTNDTSIKPQEIEIPQTVNWTAPEVIRSGKVEFSTAADVYSLAMVLWELLTGKVPFDEKGILTSDVAKLVLEQHRRPPIPTDTPPQFAQLMRDAWHEDVLKRPSATQMKETLILMRRRYMTNRTLERGKFLEDETHNSNNTPLTDSNYQENRFAAASEREQLVAASGFSMGSLSDIENDVDDEPKFDGLNRVGGHSRTHSEGSIRLTAPHERNETCVDDIDINQQYS